VYSILLTSFVLCSRYVHTYVCVFVIILGSCKRVKVSNERRLTWRKLFCVYCSYGLTNPYVIINRLFIYCSFSATKMAQIDWLIDIHDVDEDVTKSSNHKFLAAAAATKSVFVINIYLELLYILVRHYYVETGEDMFLMGVTVLLSGDASSFLTHGQSYSLTTFKKLTRLRVVRCGENRTRNNIFKKILFQTSKISQ